MASDKASLNDSVVEPETGAAADPTLERPVESTSHGAPPDSAITAQEQADAFEQAEDGIEANDYTSEDDPGYESDAASATSASLASEARNFIYENGRRYHGFREGSYSFPNDDREQDREDLKHAMYLKLFNGALHFAPLDAEKPLDAIDCEYRRLMTLSNKKLTWMRTSGICPSCSLVFLPLGADLFLQGTGTGIWAIDFADLYPNANVLGIDLSPIQTEWVPTNCKFMVDDAEDEWLHPRNHFDYIHTRHTVQGFRNWPQLMRRAFRHLKPGGWIESQEIDHMPMCHDSTLEPNNPMVEYWSHVTDGLANLGVPFRCAPEIAQYMRDAGFTNVTERVFYTPIGPWPKNRHLREVGLYWRAVLMEGLEAIALGPLTRGLGWTKEEITVFLANVRKAYLAPETHSFMPFYIIYGQKPESGIPAPPMAAADSEGAA